MTLNVAQIRHVGLFSPRLSEQAHFYSEVWGLERVAESNDAVYFRGTSPEYFLLSLHRGPTKGLHHIAYAMDGEKSVQRAAAELEKAGVRLIEQPHLLDEPGGGYGFRFVDPDGRCIELSSGVASHSDRPHAKNVEPLSVCHVVLNTPDMDRITKFYTSVLGFRVSDWSGEQMVFLRTDSKHHNI